MNDNFNINDNIPYINYISNGEETTYQFPFLIFQTSDVVVYINGQQLQNGFSVEFTPSTPGGSIILIIAPEIGTEISIVRNLDIRRVTDFQEGGSIRSRSLNREFNYQMACSQQLADALNRALILPPYSDSNNIKMELPIPQSNRAIVWNSEANALANSKMNIGEIDEQLGDALATVSKNYTEMCDMHKETLEQSAEVRKLSAACKFRYVGEIVTYSTPQTYSGLLPLNSTAFPNGYVINNCDVAYPHLWEKLVTDKAKAVDGDAHFEVYNHSDAEYESAIAENGNCKYYVINEETKTVRLPVLSSDKFCFLVVANKFEDVSEATQDSLIERVEMSLASKANKSLDNLADNIDYVVESWVADNGNSWYRKFKSGWIEQGGKVTNWARITYLVPLKSPPLIYSAQGTNQGGGANPTFNAPITNTSIEVNGTSMGGGNIYPINWFICGY